MSTATSKALLWSPRILGILTGLFLSIFALDAFSDQQTFWAALPGFLLHLTPTFMVLATVFIAWRRPWFGALIFLVFAAVYVASNLDHPSWILAIASPFGLVGALYLLSWKAQRAPPLTG